VPAPALGNGSQVGLRGSTDASAKIKQVGAS